MRELADPPNSFNFRLNAMCASRLPPDQHDNVEAAARALVESLCKCWVYLNLLRGLNEGAKAHPEAVAPFDSLFAELWCTIFEALFASAGTVIENTKGAHSLPRLISLLRRYKLPGINQTLVEIEAMLNRPDSPFRKIENWRNKVVAHNPQERKSPSFYTDNRMTLNEIEGALVMMETLLNQLSIPSIQVHHLVSGTGIHLIEQTMTMMARISAGLRENLALPEND